MHLKDHLALGHPLGDAVMHLPLLVLGLPHGGVLSPALNTRIATSLGGGAGSQAETTDNKETRGIMEHFLNFELGLCSDVLCDLMEKLRDG